MIVEVKRLFAKFDKKKTGLISREEFISCYEQYFHVDDTKLSEILDHLVDKSNGMIDYITFSEMFTPQSLHTFTLKCKDCGVNISLKVM